MSRSQCSSPGATGISGLHSRRTRGDRHSSRVEAKNPGCSRIATVISWSSLGGLKGVKPPEAFGERSRDWSPGHAGDDGPHLSMTAESRGCSRAAAPVCGFSRALHIRWPKYRSFSFSFSPYSEYSGLISLRTDWFDLHVVKGTLKSLSSTTVQKHQFFSIQPSLWFNSHICT